MNSKPEIPKEAIEAGIAALYDSGIIQEQGDAKSAVAAIFCAMERNMAELSPNSGDVAMPDEDVKVLARALAAAEGHAYDEPADLHYDKLAAKVIEKLDKQQWEVGPWFDPRDYQPIE